MGIQEKCCEKDENVCLNNKELPTSLLKPIDEIVKKEGYEKYKVFNRMISTGGGNYLGVLYEVDIKGKTADGEKETNIFIKNIIPTDNFTMVTVADAYLKEGYTYNELFKIYNDIQNEADVPIEERYKTVKSFHSISDTIFLENMTKQGFETMNRMDVMTLKFAELSVQQLAKFHGLSFVLQKHNPDYFERKLKTMKIPLTFNDDWKAYVSNMIETMMTLLDEDQKEKMRKFIPTVNTKYQRYFSEITWGCLCHGDYRQNNVLMKETDGEVTQVIPVDFQFIHYGCPLNDFFYLIFSGSDQEFRKNHLTHLKDMYYDTLEKFLKYFDMDVNFIFPRKEFERYYEERLDYGLVLAMSLLPSLFVSEDNVPDLGSEDLTKFSYSFDSRCKDRIRGIVDDFIHWGYL